MSHFLFDADKYDEVLQTKNGWNENESADVKRHASSRRTSVDVMAA